MQVAACDMTFKEALTLVVKQEHSCMGVSPPTEISEAQIRLSVSPCTARIKYTSEEH